MSDEQRDPEDDRGPADRQREQPCRIFFAAGGIVEIDVLVAVPDEQQQREDGQARRRHGHQHAGADVCPPTHQRIHASRLRATAPRRTFLIRTLVTRRGTTDRTRYRTRLRRPLTELILTWRPDASRPTMTYLTPRAGA
jgi:hypothetical protein